MHAFTLSVIIRQVVRSIEMLFNKQLIHRVLRMRPDPGLVETVGRKLGYGLWSTGVFTSGAISASGVGYEPPVG